MALEQGPEGSLREIVGTAVSKRNYPNERHRRSLRLQGYDYAERGAYFVTICTKNRACLLGDITNGEMRLNDFGRLAKAAWEEIPSHFPDIELGTLVAMPNHNPRDYCYRAPHPKGDACVAPTDRARPT